MGELPNAIGLTKQQIGEVTELLHKLTFFVSKDVQEALSIAINCLHERLKIVNDVEDIENQPDKYDLSGYTKADFVGH